MLLLIDAGNTRIKWGIPHHQQLPAPAKPAWLTITSVAHDDTDQLVAAWQQYPVSKVLISNVAGVEVKARLTALVTRAFPSVVVEWFASQAQCAGLQNHYLNPQQLGCDRFASAIAAAYLYPQQHVIVATCGTATTVDAVTAQAEFVGGMILPGLKLMAESLARNTAQLPQVAESIQVDQPFANNTDQAIVSGCIHAQAGAITLAYQSLQKKQAESVICLISGGAAPYLLPHLPFQCDHIANLVLTGLFVVAQSVSS
ncbi:type III pantothenate kinase [Undibacterium sp. RuRC25W]|uniref:type III pantothenate kinase n=1 Tax=Undibacterium sp. RuRC25W TaxID=3413047 RepID=UPI003BF14F62